MKNILRIARIELSLLFYSPVAWIVLLVFIIQSGWGYMSTIERLEQAQQMGMTLSGLTDNVFAGFRSLFPKMQEYLYLYIPLLTMGLISRETHSGSIKLLYSSPIRVFDIVAGKYLAMIIYCFLLMCILLGLGVLSIFTIKDVDFTFILSGIIGLYLLICAYSAVGLFMSSLTSYQVVAAISTLVVLAILNFIGGLWQDIEFVRDITYFLSISGRAEESINGLLGSNDILYFLIVIAMFLGLTFLKLQFERRTISLSLKVGGYVGLIAFMLLIGYIGSLPQYIFYIDMTADQTRTLTRPSREVIAKINEPVVMTTYVNLLDENYFMGLPSFQNNDKRSFDKYFRFMPYMRMDYVYYWDHSENERLYKENPGLNDEQLAKKMAKINGMDFDKFLRPEQIKKIVDLKPERNRLVRTLSYKGKKVFLRMFDDIMKYPSEKETSAALKKLIAKSPKVGFATGHRERNITKTGDNDYEVSTNEITFRYSLLNQGFDIRSVSLDQPGLRKQVDVLVIADPLTAYTSGELTNLAGYINEGGNLLIAGEPGSQAILNPILSLAGVEMGDGMLVQKSQNFEPSFVLSGLATKNWLQIAGNGEYLNKDSAFVTTPTVAPVRLLPNSPFRNLPILVTQASNTWLIPDLRVDKTKELTDARKNEDKKSYPVALALRRAIPRGEQRIFIIGDADFMNNAESRRRTPRSINFAFVTELFKWFSDGEFPIDTTRPEPQDNRILMNSARLTWIRWAWMGILPSLIALSVSWILIARKRR
ncbi:ABC-2 type transport system permease protein [Mucilaginibacter sp. OK268]|uniref:Gldg family protein n=1 Tax=Mucilaginibacter sp. OK268 TaxID=1881048 RepID=UPI0008867144|nr:Gldg family protein [Mucilaginibacter sp. OK268]SDP45636.1 ABC-2 type transport system permease protein [Mucilaginibacter sp. OK268]